MLYWIFSAGFLFFVYCGSNFGGRKDLTFCRFRVNIPPTANSPSKFLVRGVFLRPHFIPQSFPEHLETVETRAAKRMWFSDERVIKCLKCPEKLFIIYLGPRCRRFESCHPDHAGASDDRLLRFFCPLCSLHTSIICTNSSSTPVPGNKNTRGTYNNDTKQKENG